MDRSQAYYNDFSHSYERERIRGYHRLIDDLEIEVAAPLSEGRRVLEIGCGTGLILERLKQRSVSCWGIDLSPKMIKKAQERGLNVLLGNVLHIPFADSSFDLVCSFKVLAHVEAIDRAIREITRVTVPGGLMVLEFYNPWSVRYVAKRMAGPQPISADKNEADVYTRWDSPRAIPKLLPSGVELIGFRGVRVFTPFGAIHKIPVVAPAVSFLERMALNSPFRNFGGFLIAILRKT